MKQITPHISRSVLAFGMFLGLCQGAFATDLLDLPSQVFNSCGNANSLTAPSIEAFAEAGWLEKSNLNLPRQHRKIATDGLLASTFTDDKTKAGWSEKIEVIENLLISLILTANDGDGRIFITEGTAPAVVFVMKQDPKDGSISGKYIRCFYAGPTSMYADTNFRTHTKLNPKKLFLDAYSGIEAIHTAWRLTEDGKTVTIDAITGRFTKKTMPILNRPPEAALGISLLRIEH